jgi:protein gp37
MSSSSAIEWCDATWNPWRGCDKVSPGCAHCYMFTAQRRYGRDPDLIVRAADSTFWAPWRAKAWRELPAGARVFTCSWSDFFHEEADGWRDDAWTVIAGRRDLVWQILTKRPERIAECLPSDWGRGWPHVWLGTSIENRRFVHRADVLRAAPAAVRFISAEPLLGPLYPATFSAVHGQVWHDGYDGPALDLTGIDWLIVGGESGPGHRPIGEEWVRRLRDHARAAGAAFFLKQWGGARPGGEALLDGREWREFPRVAVAA